MQDPGAQGPARQMSVCSGLTTRLLIFIVTIPGVAFGNQRFTPFTITTSASGAASVYAADLDADGLVDVLSASSTDGKLAWYRNEGGGVFSSQRLVSGNTMGVWSVYAADLDGDGRMDVLSAAFAQNRIAWYRNEDGNTFSAPRVITTTASGAMSVYAADMDADGLLDVLSASSIDSTIAWYRNEGAGVFSSQRVLTTEAQGAMSVYAADLDGDGALDVLSASSDDHTIAWYRNEGGGAFSAQRVITADANGASSVHAADLDGDGRLDVLSASSNDNTIAWYRNEDGEAFSPPRVVTTGAEGALSVYAADLDGDGLLDVLSASYGQNSIAWYRNEGSGAFSSQRVITADANGAGSVFAVDLDNNGLLDVLSASFQDNKIAWYRNEGGDVFAVQRVITAAASGASSVYATDLDGDGLPDVLTSAANDNTITWYHNEGGGTFSPQRVITVHANGVVSLYATDLDGDGLPDVLSASANDNTIAWYRNEGGGVFSSQHVITVDAYGARSVHAADLDADGFVDVLSASSFDNKIAWYRNEGGSSGFSPQRVISSDAAVAMAVHAADLDGDGRQDVLSASFYDRTIAWYRNEGGGLFSLKRVIAADANGVVSMHAADLDGDGALDVLSAFKNDNKIVWYRNEGGGAFSSQRVITTEAHGALSVHAADLNDDGRLDVLSASVDDNTIAWYRNEGDGVFSPQRVITSDAAGASSVFAADLDGDGRLDVLSASSDDNTIAWYPAFQYASMSLSVNASADMCMRSHRCADPSELPASELGRMIHIEGNMAIPRPWVFSVGSPLIVDGQGSMLRCDLDPPGQVCIQVMTRQFAVFRNLTLGGSGMSKILETQYVWDFRLVHVTFQSEFKHPSPLVAIRSQLPPMQTGCVRLDHVGVQHSIAQSFAVFHVSSLVRVLFTNSWFVNITQSKTVTSCLETAAALFHADGVLHVGLDNITMRDLHGCLPILNAARTHRVFIRDSVLDNAECTSTRGCQSLFQFNDVASLQLSSSTFARTTCVNCTGGVFQLKDVASAELSSARFTNHTCVNCTGGAIQLKDVSSLTLSSVRFAHNTCVNCPGGGLQVTFSRLATTLASENVTFVHNAAAYGGGIAILDSTPSLELWRPTQARMLANMTFTGNSADIAGGAAYWHSALKFTTPLGIDFQLQDQPPVVLLQRCNFERNRAPHGAAFAAENANVVASFSTFEANFATASGAGVWLLRSSGMFRHCLWSDNRIFLGLGPTGLPHYGGGGAAVFASECLLSGILLADSIFVNNSVAGQGSSGGAVHATTCSVRLMGVRLEGNSAVTTRGGAVACIECGLLDIQGTDMVNNAASLAGGAVWVQGTTLQAQQWHCADNVVMSLSPEVHGGGCLAAVASTARIDGDTAMLNNGVLSPTGAGGHLFADCGSAMTVADSVHVATGSAAIGSNVFVECYGVLGAAPSRLPDHILFSSTISSGTAGMKLTGAPSALINSIGAAAPVAIFRLVDVFGSHRWEDNHTVCTVSAVGNDTGEPATLLSSTRFFAANGFVQLYPFAVLSNEDDTAVDLHVSCVTPLAAKISTTVAVELVLPELAILPPLPPAIVVTRQPLTIHLQVLSQANLVRDSLKCAAVCDEAVAMSGTTAIGTRDSVVFDSVAVTGVIGHVYQLHIECTLGTVALPPLPPIDVRIALCPRGTEPDDSGTQCRACPLNTHSEGGRSKCTGCPPVGAACTSGVLTVLPGFFPANPTLLGMPPHDLLDNSSSTTSHMMLDETTVLYPCWNAEACAAPTTNRRFGCAVGYEGPLCGVCDLSVDFVRSGRVCTECWPRVLNIMVLLSVALVVIIALVYIAVFQSVKRASPRKIVLRILLSYLQMLSSLGLFQAQATQTFRDIFGVSEAIGGSFVSWPPLQCVLRLSYYTKFALNMSLPFLLIPVCIGLAAITMLFRAAFNAHNRQRASLAMVLEDTQAPRPGEQRSSFPSETSARRQRPHPCADFQRYIRGKVYLAPAVFVLFLSYNVLSTTAATMFKCRPEVLGGVRFLDADLSVPCYDAAHIAGMAAAGCMGLAFNIGMPLLLWLFLRRNKHKLFEPKIFSRFGFLYQGYSVNRGRYAWESVVMLRKFVIVMAASTVEDPWYQAIAGISIVVIALVLQALFRPYDQQLYNRLETAVLVVLSITQVVSLIFLRSETVLMSPAERLHINVVVTVLLVLLNGGMLLALLYFIVKHMQCSRPRLRPAGQTAAEESLNVPGCVSNVAAGVAAIRRDASANSSAYGPLPLAYWMKNPVQRKTRAP